VETVWVLGDQLNRRLGALADADPSSTRVLLVESDAKLAAKRWHVQRAHLVVTAMRRFAAELVDEGFAVDHRKAPSLAAGFRDHVAEHRPEKVRAMEPASWDGWALLERLDVELVRSDQFLCHPEEFASWAGDRAIKMEDFYRWQRPRRHLGDDAGRGPAPPRPRRRRRPPPVRPPRGRHAVDELVDGPHPAQPLPQPRAPPPR